MSRIGNKPVEITTGVEFMMNGRDVEVKGSKGTLNWTFPVDIAITQEENMLSFSPKGNGKQTKANWGLTRAMVANMIEGVSKGFEKKLTLKGVGYRANMQGNTLNLTVGFSHPVSFEVPQGLTVVTPEPTIITIAGYNKQVVGQFAANVRAVRPVEPYKGKGIRYADEHVIMKEGKKK